MPGYDNIAPYYDLLSGLVFGKQLTNAESHFLSSVNNPTNILVFGGGTGKTLSTITGLYPKATICYLEASSSMISKAKQRLYPDSGLVRFVHGDEQILQNQIQQFDLIITSFVLDVFSKTRLDHVMNILNRQLKPGGHWIQTDFYVNCQSPGWQKVLVSTMYFFFRLTANQLNRQLVNFDQYFENRRLQVKDQKSFCRNMAKTVLYHKPQEIDPNHWKK